MSWTKVSWINQPLWNNSAGGCSGLEEDEIAPETELDRLSEEASGEALGDAHQVAGLRDEIPDLTRLLTHHRDGVVGILE